MTAFGRGLALAMMIATGGVSPALAQAGAYGTEDGYGGDGIGWGPAYRRDTTFRPAIGFYGGVERPNPYAPPGATGSLGGPGASLTPRRARPPTSAQRRAVRHSRAARPEPSRIR